MSLLSELTSLLDGLNVPVETGVFSDPAPDRYAVLTPIVDTYDLFSDNAPGLDVEEVRISLFDKGNYILLAHGNFAHATFYKSDLFNCRIANSCYEGTRFVSTSTNDQYIDTDSTMTNEEWTHPTEGQVMQ